MKQRHVIAHVSCQRLWPAKSMSKITVVVASRHSVWECLFSDNREVVQVLPWVPGQSWIRDLTFLKLSFFHLEVCLMILIICWLPFTCQTFVYTYVHVLTYTAPLNSMGLKSTFMWTFFSLNMYHSTIWSIDEWISRCRTPYMEDWLDYQLWRWCP